MASIYPAAALLLILLPVAGCGPRQDAPRRVPVASLEGERIRGSAVLSSGGAGRAITWGDRLLEWRLPDGGVRVLDAGRSGGFGRAGCLVDVDGDGLEDLVLQEGVEGGRLVWRKAPEWTPHVIDSSADTPDCLGATLYGRRGVLVIHRYQQVRFYEIPRDLNAAWPYREIYSIYTPSRQAGLMLADVDGDGIADLYAGNYWIRGPESFELPWRLFAVNTWFEQETSATLSLALADLAGTGAPQLAASQAEMKDARLAWFQKPANPEQLWIEHRVRMDEPLRFAAALLAGDFDGDAKTDLLVGENNGGESRLLLFRNEGKDMLRGAVIASGKPVLALHLLPAGEAGGKAVLSVGPRAIEIWRFR